MTTKRILTIVSIFLLTGCSHFIKQTPAQNSQSSDESAIQLSEAAVSVSQSLNELVGIEKNAIPAYKLNQLTNPSPFNLPGTVSIDWSGPIEPLLQKLAAMSNYKLRILGRRSAIPIIATLNAKEIPLAYLLRDLDYQCGHKARLFVYPGQKIIELRYAKT